MIALCDQHIKIWVVIPWKYPSLLLWSFFKLSHLVFHRRREITAIGFKRTWGSKLNKSLVFCLTVFHPACSFTKSLSFSGCPCQPLLISSNQYLHCTAVRDRFAFNSSFSHSYQATKMLCLFQKIPSRYIKKENVLCAYAYMMSSCIHLSGPDSVPTLHCWGVCGQ